MPKKDDPTREEMERVGQAFARSMGGSFGGLAAGLPLRPGTSVTKMPKMRVGNEVDDAVNHALRRPAPTQTETEEVVDPKLVEVERKLEIARLEALKDDIEYWKKTKGIVSEPVKPAVDPAVSEAAKLSDARKLVLDAAQAQEAARQRRKLAKKIGV